HSFFRADKHRRSRPILAVIKNLTCFIVVRVEFDLRLFEDGALASFDIVTINRRGTRKTRESVKGFLVLSLAAESTDRPDARQLYIVIVRAILFENTHNALRILHIKGEPTFPQQAHAM